MLSVHFLNVGKGNCTIIDFPSSRMSMIDIDNSRIKDDDDALTDPIDYYIKKFADRSLFRFILSHPDMDHLSGFDELVKKVTIANLWDTKHNRTFSDSDWETSPYNRNDWDTYMRLRKKNENPRWITPLRGESSDCCWTQDNIKILSPSASLIELSDSTGEYNHLSYVLMVEYAGVKIMLSGDASMETWDDIIDKYGTESLKADIFLAPHHGSKNCIHEDAFKAIDPSFVIVSVVKGVDYDYEFYRKLAKRDVLSTKYYGNIKIDIKDDGTYLPIIVEKNGSK